MHPFRPPAAIDLMSLIRAARTLRYCAGGHTTVLPNWRFRVNHETYDQLVLAPVQPHVPLFPLQHPVDPKKPMTLFGIRIEPAYEMNDGTIRLSFEAEGTFEVTL